MRKFHPNVRSFKADWERKLKTQFTSVDDHEFVVLVFWFRRQLTSSKNIRHPKKVQFNEKYHNPFLRHNHIRRISMNLFAIAKSKSIYFGSCRDAESSTWKISSTSSSSNDKFTERKKRKTGKCKRQKNVCPWNEWLTETMRIREICIATFCFRNMNDSDAQRRLHSHEKARQTICANEKWKPFILNSLFFHCLLFFGSHFAQARAIHCWRPFVTLLQTAVFAHFRCVQFAHNNHLETNCVTCQNQKHERRFHWSHFILSLVRFVSFFFFQSLLFLMFKFAYAWQKQKMENENTSDPSRTDFSGLNKATHSDKFTKLICIVFVSLFGNICHRQFHRSSQ